MSARTSFFSSLWQGILSRIGALETAVGEIPNPDNYTDKDDVRALTGYSDGDRVLCLENDYIYQFVAANATADDDNIVLCPDDITHPAPGRWVRLTQYSPLDHNHDADYQKLIVTPTQNRFTAVNASGQLIETTYHANSWAPYTHEHTEYATTTALETVETNLQNLSTTVDGKMNILTPLAGNVDEIVTVAASGQPQMSGTKIAAISTKNISITVPDDETGYTHDTGVATEPANMQVCDADGRVLGTPGQVDIRKILNETSGFWEITVISYTGLLTNAKLSFV
jgi:hypothetical protein